MPCDPAALVRPLSPANTSSTRRLPTARSCVRTTSQPPAVGSISSCCCHLQTAAMALRPIISYLLFALDLLAGRQTSTNGREARLLAHVQATVPPGQPGPLLEAIDSYHHTTEWFMNVGDGKGRVLTDALEALAPPAKAVLELGTYCGYSTVLLASHLRDPAGRVYTVDILEENVAVARGIIGHAGLSDRVVHVVKPLAAGLEELKAGLASQGLAAFDLVFVDHDKGAYVSDVQLLLDHGLIRRGGVVVADNLRIPGAPDYVKWMRSAPEFEFQETSVCLGASALWLHDTIGVSVFKGGEAAAAAAGAGAAAGGGAQAAGAAGAGAEAAGDTAKAEL